MLETNKKQILCMLGICEHEMGDENCLWPKVCDRDLDYVKKQIEKIINLEAKKLLMEKETKRLSKQTTKAIKKTTKPTKKRVIKKAIKTTKKSTK